MTPERSWSDSSVVVDAVVDEGASRHVARMWHALQRAGIDVSSVSDDAPHLTLVTMFETTPQTVSHSLAGVDLAPPPVTFGHIGYFGPPGHALFLAPTPSVELMEFHQRVWETLCGAVPNQGPFSTPGTWTPHITLAMGVAPAHVGLACAALEGLPMLFEARLTHIRAHSRSLSQRWADRLNPPATPSIGTRTPTGSPGR